MTTEEAAKLVKLAAARERHLWRQAMRDHLAAFRRALDDYDGDDQKRLLPNIMTRLDTCKMIEIRVDALRRQIASDEADAGGGAELAIRMAISGIDQNDLEL